MASSSKLIDLTADSLPQPDSRPPQAVPVEVRAELERIKLSPEFRQSEQCKRLLAHLVEQSISGAPEQLKERAIGVALFGLVPGYDTNENPIVRVRANDIRKRLARFYQENPSPAVRLEVPPGAYRVEFRRLSMALPSPPPAPVDESPATRPEPPAAQPAVARRRRLPVRAAGAIAATAAALAGLAWGLTRQSALERLWEPAFDDSSRAVIYVAQPLVYALGPMAAFRDGMPAPAQPSSSRRPSFPPTNSNPLLLAATPVAPADDYVDGGTAAAVARIYGWMVQHHHAADIRFERRAEAAELKRSPVIMIGTFEDSWGLSQTRSLRFGIETVQGSKVVRDRQSGRVWSSPVRGSTNSTIDDYLVISRTVRPETRQLVIGAAALTSAGVQAAADLLSDPAAFDRILGQVQFDRSRPNVQIVCHVRLNGSPSRPVLLTSSSW